MLQALVHKTAAGPPKDPYISRCQMHQRTLKTPQALLWIQAFWCGLKALQACRNWNPSISFWIENPAGMQSYNSKHIHVDWKLYRHVEFFIHGHPCGPQTLQACRALTSNMSRVYWKPYKHVDFQIQVYQCVLKTLQALKGKRRLLTHQDPERINK